MCCLQVEDEDEDEDGGGGGGPPLWIKDGVRIVCKSTKRIGTLRLRAGSGDVAIPGTKALHGRCTSAQAGRRQARQGRHRCAGQHRCAWPGIMAPKKFAYNCVTHGTAITALPLNDFGTYNSEVRLNCCSHGCGARHNCAPLTVVTVVCVRCTQNFENRFSWSEFTGDIWDMVENESIGQSFDDDEIRQRMWYRYAGVA